AVLTAAEQNDHGIITLELRELAQSAAGIRQFKIRQRGARDETLTHVDVTPCLVGSNAWDVQANSVVSKRWPGRVSRVRTTRFGALKAAQSCATNVSLWRESMADG